MSVSVHTRMKWITKEVRDSVDPRSMSEDSVFLYSIPSLDEFGDGTIDYPSEIGSAKLRLNGGEVLISKLNPRKSRVLIAAKHDIPTLASTEFIALEPSRALDPRFLSFWLQCEPTRQSLDGATMSVTRSHQRVRPEVLLGSAINLPPISIQRSIADYLDRETARIDALISAKRKMMELLEERFDAAVFDAITGGGSSERTRNPSKLEWIDAIPANWTTPPVVANFAVHLGKMLNVEATASPHQFPYLRNLNVQWDEIEVSDVATMHFDSYERRVFALRDGDLLVCEGGEVGRAAVWHEELPVCYFQKALHRLRPLRDANSRYLMYCLRAAAKRDVFAVEGNLSTITHLTLEKLKAQRFPWPPAEEQVEIVKRLDELTDSTRAVKAALRRQSECLIERRGAVINMALTGPLAIPEAA